MLLGENITDDDEWDIAWNCPRWDGVDRIPTDILVCTFRTLEEMAAIPGMVQQAIKARGVDLSELLRTG
jgi:hypothetical protein